MVCAIGQNPSYANQTICDKTIHYIEQLVYHRFPKAGGVEILNLYSRIDTKKTHRTDLLLLAAARVTRRKIQQHEDFVIFTGKNKKQRAYNFPKRAMQLRRLLRGKRVWKVDIGTDYAPHPGNQRITYTNLTHPLGRYLFVDVDSKQPNQTTTETDRRAHQGVCRPKRR
jgi:hypothetical protein